MTTIPRHRLEALQRRLARSSHAAVARSHKSRSAGDSGSRDESGAVLVLALVFLVVVSVIVGALTTWTTNDLSNSHNFASTQTVNSSATNAVNLAVQTIRYNPLLYTASGGTNVDQTLNASPPNYCWGSPAVPFSQAFNMNVYCTTVWNPSSSKTRQVTVSACRAPTAGMAAWTAAQSSCPQAPFLQAIVTFDDYPAGVSAPSNVQCVVYCGNTMTINSWSWDPTVPKVASVSGLAGDFDGGAPITINGSGFTSGATVNFVISNPLAQLQSTSTLSVQQVVAATNVTVNVATQTITANAPAVTTLANYYITVTTPGGGTSLVNPSALFVYSSKAPVVTGLTPTSGYTTHGTAITITGTGFVNDPNNLTTVTMVQESGGSVVSPTNQQNATAVQVVSNTSITAITYPFTTVNQSFYIVVTTGSGGASQTTTSAVFTFTQAPP